MKYSVSVHWFKDEARVSIDAVEYIGGQHEDFSAIGCVHSLVLRSTESRKDFATKLREAADQLESK